jgi:imidazolonepropionase-like amidohydrolase
VPAGAAVVDGDGHTLLPGLIDAHTHAFGAALERALVFGVTTELDMFTDHRQAAEWRREQAEGAPRRADIFSAGTMVTAPKGHGTQFGLPIPTLGSSADAAAFVDARLAEGSDFIKVVYEAGDAYGTGRPTLSEEALRAVITAARDRGARVVVHVSTLAAARAAIDAGAHGLVHVFGDAPATDAVIELARTRGVFVIPTLSVIESVTGTPGSAALLTVEALAPYFLPNEHAELKAAFPDNSRSTVRLAHALQAVRQLHAVGVPILAGSDAPNPGTMHGATMHRELELLVMAGLTPVEALRAATSAPARAFGLDDRGRIVAGQRADMLLVRGNPARDITDTRNIVGVWKGGRRLDRRPAPDAAEVAAAVESGIISEFDDAGVTARFGNGWQISTDSMMGGASEAAMQLAKPGAAGSTGALEVHGTISTASPVTWAGAMFFPGPTPMAPANLSRFKEIVFRARGDGREYYVMLFATRLGQQPAMMAFTAGPEWREHTMAFSAFSAALDGSDVTGILFSAGAPAGAFRFQIDDVRLR